MKRDLIVAFIVLCFSCIAYAQDDYNIGNTSNINQIKRNNNETENIVGEQFKFIPMWEWKKGMKFVVLPDKTNIGSHLPLKPCGHMPKRNELAGKILQINKIEERQVSCPRGQCTRTYIGFEVDGSDVCYEYEYIGSKQEMKTSIAYSFQNIDGLRYVSDIDKLRKMLVGKTLYVMSRRWKGDRIAVAQAKKYIPAKIINVGYSTDTCCDTSIAFQTKDGVKAYFGFMLSGTNMPSYSRSYTSNGIDNFFSRKNPKNGYKGRDKMWDPIVKGVIQVGMTEEEVVWAWGKPTRINRSSYGPEQWVYGLQYLYFKKGICVGFNE